MPAPHNLEAERAVLGACLVSKPALERILSTLEPDDFYSQTHRILFAAIKAVAREYDKIDHLLLLPHLPESDREDLKNKLFVLMESLPTAANANLYARDVLAASRARRAMEVALTLSDSLEHGTQEDFVEAPSKAIAELEEIIRNDTAESARPITAGLDDLARWMHEARENKGVTGIRTGIGKLDKAIKGLNPGRMYVFAGRPGSGKSLICGQIALTAARQGKRVLLCSPEMRLGEYLRRLTCASAGVSGEHVEEGKITEEEERRIFQEGAKMDKLAFYVNDRGTQTVSDVKRAVMRYEPDLLVVDYLQRLMPEDRGAKRYEQVSQVSFDLDRLKKDFDIPVLAAAQLSRSSEQRGDKRPMLSDLRDSGTIEQDADVVGMLYRPSHYEEDASETTIEFALEKNRHGSLFQTELYTDDGLWVSDQREVLVGRA